MEKQPQLYEVNILQYYQLFAPFRKDNLGAEAICALIEKKALELLNQISIIVVPPPNKVSN